MNPSCPEGQSQFIAAGCDVSGDPAHSTSCVQFNNVDTTTIPNIITKAALKCSLLSTSLCSATNGSDTWEEVYPQSASGPLNDLVSIWNGAHLDIVFNKINSATWGDEVFNELIAPLSDPSCRTNGFQPYPIICNSALGLIAYELAYLGPAVVLNSAGWDKSAAAGGNYLKNDQQENEVGGSFWADPLEEQRLTGVDTINPIPARGIIWDNSTCWAGPAGQTHFGVPIENGYFVHPAQENGYAHAEMYPTTSIMRVRHDRDSHVHRSSLHTPDPSRFTRPDFWPHRRLG